MDGRNHINARVQYTVPDICQTTRETVPAKSYFRVTVIHRNKLQWKLFHCVYDAPDIQPSVLVAHCHNQ
jgi:hypothetical protein